MKKYREKLLCSCGRQIRRQNLARHRRTARHNRHISQNRNLAFESPVAARPILDEMPNMSFESLEEGESSEKDVEMHDNTLNYSKEDLKLRKLMLEHPGTFTGRKQFL